LAFRARQNLAWSCGVSRCVFGPTMLKFAPNHMKKLLPLIVAVSTLAIGQSAPLPNPEILLRHLQENQKQIEAIRKNYICIDDEEEYQLDGDGNTKKKEVKQYEFYFVEGFPIKRLLSKEGVALSDSERRKEDERVAKDEKKAHERRAKTERGEHDKNAISVSTFLRASTLNNLRRESYQGHEVIAMDFVPNPAFHPDGLAESIVNKLGGTIWIDEEANQVVRLEAKLLKNQSAGLGLASVKEGTSFILEQQKINDELWMPSLTDGNIGVRVVFKGIRQRNVDHYSNYKKFKSTTRILGVEEVK
jgi:hypothetical protein